MVVRAGVAFVRRCGLAGRLVRLARVRSGLVPVQRLDGNRARNSGWRPCTRIVVLVLLSDWKLGVTSDCLPDRIEVAHISGTSCSALVRMWDSKALLSRREPPKL